MPTYLRMHQIKSILQLTQRGTLIREIVRLTGLHRNTIWGYLLRLQSSGLPCEELVKLPGEDLRV